MRQMLLWVAVIPVVACRPQPDTSATRADTAAAAVKPDSAGPGHHIPVDSTRPTVQPPIIPQGGGGTAGETVTVQHLVESDAMVGKRVRVTGTCLGLRVPPVAVGSPPRTRSDWQLESQGFAIYVAGPFPAECGPAGGAGGPVTIEAVVWQDTLPTLGAGPARPRRYLEWSDR